jgi:hypothetical protein
VEGKIEFTSSNTTIGAADAPIYLVARGHDITFEKKTKMYGGIYTDKNWNRAQIDLDGIVYVGGISPSNNGSSSLNLGPAPWFDPRGTVSLGGSSGMSIAKFTGPLP